MPHRRRVEIRQASGLLCAIRLCRHGFLAIRYCLHVIIGREWCSFQMVNFMGIMIVKCANWCSGVVDSWLIVERRLTLMDVITSMDSSKLADCRGMAGWVWLISLGRWRK